MTYKRPIGASIIPDTFQPHEWDQFLLKLETVRPSAAFVIGNINRAYEVKSVCADDADLIFREYDPANQRAENSFDNQYHQLDVTRDPRWSVDTARTALGSAVDDFRILRGINEPSHNDAVKGKELEQLLGWLIDLAYYAQEDNQRWSIGEFATDKTIKAYEKLDVQNGRWDEFLYMCDDLCRDWHTLTMHSYSSFFSLANQMIAGGADMLNRDTLAYERWRDIKVADKKIIYNGGLVMPPNFNTGRELLITNIRAAELGLNPIPYGITETGMDVKTNIANYDRARNTFTQNPVADAMRGYLGHYHYWAWVEGVPVNEYTADQFARMFFRNIAAYITSHPSNLLYVTPFTAAMSGEWQDAGFNINHPLNDPFWELAAQFNDVFEAAMDDPNVPDTPDTPPDIGDDPTDSDKRFPPDDSPLWAAWDVIKNHDDLHTNIRRTPRVANNIVGRVTGEPLGALLVLSDDWTVKNQWGEWTPIWTTNGVKGWVTANNISLIATDPDPDPDPPPVIGDNSGCWSVVGSNIIGAVLFAILLGFILAGCEEIPTPTQEGDPTPTQEILQPTPTP